MNNVLAQISIWPPISTTRFMGKPKNLAAFIELRAIQANSFSRHSAIPRFAGLGMTVSRLRKKEVSIMSNSRPIDWHSFSKSGMLGVS